MEIPEELVLMPYSQVSPHHSTAEMHHIAFLNLVSLW